MQDVHGVDDHGAVGGIFADGIAELLDGLEGMIVKRILPGIHTVGGPVAVDAPDGNLAVSSGLDEHLRQQRRLGIIPIDQDGDAPLPAVIKGLSCHIG